MAIDTIVTSVDAITEDGAYKAGDTITLSVTFSQVVDVTGTPVLALGGMGSASYVSGSGTNTLTFSYVVEAGDSSADLDYFDIGSLTGGTITGPDANNAILDLPTPGTAGSLGANARW